MTSKANQDTPPVRLLTEKEAAVYLGISRSALRQQRMNGARVGRLPIVPWVQLGRAVRYDRISLDRFIAEHVVDSTGGAEDGAR